jgi:hypothetical protein
MPEGPGLAALESPELTEMLAELLPTLDLLIEVGDQHRFDTRILLTRVRPGGPTSSTPSRTARLMG